MPDRVASRRIPDGDVFVIVQLFISLVLVVFAAGISGFHDDDDPWLAACLVLTQLLPLGLSAGVLLARWPRARPLTVVSVVYSMLATSFMLLVTNRYTMLLVFAAWWISILVRMPSPGPKSSIEAGQEPQAEATQHAVSSIPPKIGVVIALEAFLLCASGFASVVVFNAIAHGLRGLYTAAFVVTQAITGTPFLLAAVASVTAAASLPVTRRWGRAFLLSVIWLRVAFIMAVLAEVAPSTADASDADARIPVALCIGVMPILLLVGEAWLMADERVRTYLAADRPTQETRSHRAPSDERAAPDKPAPTGGIRPPSPPSPAGGRPE